MKTSQIAILVIFLSVICAAASGILALVSKVTEKDIEKMKVKKIEEALKTVLGNFDNNPSGEKLIYQQDGREVVFFPAKKNNALFSFAATASSPKGYGGKISVMANISPEGTIGTVIVTEQNETPGLGTVVTNRTRTKTLSDIISGKKDNSLPPNPVLDSFRGKNTSSAPYKLKKDGGEIDSITGATISSAAVLDAVNTIGAAYQAHKEELLAKFATP